VRDAQEQLLSWSGAMGHTEVLNEFVRKLFSRGVGVVLVRPSLIAHWRVRVWRRKAFPKPIALIQPEPMVQEVGNTPILKRIEVAMDNPVSETDVTLGFEPIDVIPISCCQEDHLINAFGILVGSGDDFAAGVVGKIAPKILHVFLMAHDPRISKGTRRCLRTIILICLIDRDRGLCPFLAARGA